MTALAESATYCGAMPTVELCGAEMSTPLFAGTAIFWQQECSAVFMAPQSPAIFLQQAISAALICENVAMQARLGVAVKRHSNNAAKMERVKRT